MKVIKSKRLTSIIEIFDDNFDLLIDIGSDHGLTGILALQNNFVKKVWNVDIKPTALASSIKNSKIYHLSEENEFFCSDGFDELPIDRIETKTILIIAGLGVKKILKILEKLPPIIKNIILLPHNNQVFLVREWANHKHWKIYDEKYLKEKNIIYIVFYLKKVLEEPEKINIFFGDKKFYTKNLPISKEYYDLMKEKIIKKSNKYWSLWEKNFLETLVNFV